MRFPVGSNLAVKISPECPDSSITGACSALVLGVYNHQYPSHRYIGSTAYRLYQCARSRGIGAGEGPLAQVLPLDNKLSGGLICWSLFCRHVPSGMLSSQTVIFQCRKWVSIDTSVCGRRAHLLCRAACERISRQLVVSSEFVVSKLGLFAARSHTWSVHLTGCDGACRNTLTNSPLLISHAGATLQMPLIPKGPLPLHVSIQPPATVLPSIAHFSQHQCSVLVTEWLHDRGLIAARLDLSHRTLRCCRHYGCE